MLEGFKELPITDIRHQDAALYQVQDVILNRRVKLEEQEEEKVVSPQRSKHKERKMTAELKHENKTKHETKTKYEITLPGDWILAGRVSFKYMVIIVVLIGFKAIHKKSKLTIRFYFEVKQYICHKI